MEDPIRVTWIDDKFINPTDARTIQANSINQVSGDHLSVELVPSRNDEFFGWVNQFDDQDRPRPDILILDFKLAQSPVFSESLKLDDGYKLRKMLELTPLRLVPKYLVSAVFDEKLVGPNIEGFEWILANPVESKTVSEQLISDGKDYRLVNKFASDYSEKPEEAISTLIEQMGAPECSCEEITDLMRHALGRAQQSSNTKVHAQIDSAGVGSEANALVFSRWLRGILLIRLGPLIDAPSVANLLGADQDFFLRELPDLVNAQRFSASYQGLFKYLDSPRWWRAEIISWILDSFKDITPGPISHLAPCVAEKLRIPEQHRAHCAICEELWPDVVAYDVDDPDELRQVHRYCSEAVEDQEQVIGFDEIRFFEKD